MRLNKKRLTARERKEELTGYAFILPNLIGFLIFIILPVAFSLVMSFSKWSVAGGIKGMEFLGLENFIKIWKDDRFIFSLGNNLVYTFGSVPITIVLAILLAVLLNGKLFCRNFLRTSFFMPHISSVVSVAVVWMVVLEPQNGPLNQILRTIGISNPPGWFQSIDWAMPGLILMSIWKSVGYFAIIFISGLQSIPKEMYEAADIDGAGWWKKLFKVTVPMLTPIIFFVVVIATINSFKVFDQINIMTEGGPGYSTSVLVYTIYYYAFKLFNMGYASAIAWVLFILIFIITVIQWRGQKKWVNY